MVGGDWFTQYLQNLKPKNPPSVNLTGRPTNLVNALGFPTALTPNFVPPSPASSSTLNNQPGLSQPGFLQQLFNQLLGNSQSPYRQPSAQEILQEATKTAAAQYDPQINAIERQISRAKGSAGKNKKELKNLYGAAADAYNEDIASSKKTGAAAVADEKERQKNLQDNLKSDYSSSLNDQLSQFANLGIQDAAPEATKQQRTDLDYLSKLNDTLGNANLSDLNEENNADINYYNEGKGIARLQGSQAINDLMSQLTDYVNNQNDSITGLQGQRQAAISQLQQQLTQQAAQQQQTNANQTWDRLFKLAGLYQQINPKQNQPTAHNGLNAASQYLASVTSPQKARDTMGAIQLLLGTQPFRENRVKVGNDQFVKLTPEQAASYAGQYADQNGWAAMDKLALMQAMLAYYGKL